MAVTQSKVKDKNKVFEISDYFIKKAKESKRPITNKKIQKLLYYAQAWSIVKRGKTIFSDDIEAWVHGPAVPRVYSRFATYGSDNVSPHFKMSDLTTSKLSNDETDLLEAVWKTYGKYSGDDLEVLTHSEKPWQDAREGVQSYEPSNKVITISAMKKYYGEKEEQSRKKA